MRRNSVGCHGVGWGCGAGLQLGSLRLFTAFLLADAVTSGGRISSLVRLTEDIKAGLHIDLNHFLATHSSLDLL
jgi:hypothetical protein